MKTYARIENGRVAEIITSMVYEVDAPVPPQGEQTPVDWPTFKAGDEVPIDRRFIPELVATLVDVTGLAVKEGDAYSGGKFSTYIPPAPSPAEILARNTSTRDTLLGIATARIAPLQDAADLGVATSAESSALTSWKQYRVAVNRADLTQAPPAWPSQPA
ncbi:tail fiber assembly protein [Cupriavidus metallidurans]|uniref:tail fiber assembly protein n=1 Tax=Cupriavidus metallidurans TaxID=119219 RepID=UPI0035C6F738